MVSIRRFGANRSFSAALNLVAKPIQHHHLANG
jgi:hypothetical protein